MVANRAVRVAADRRAAVLGSPISHSLSPVMHRAAYQALDLNWRYDAIDCDAELMPGLVAAMDERWAGLSITMPVKAAAAALASVSSTRVKLLGVANTLIPVDGGWSAENTDVDGVVGSLLAAGLDQPRRVLIIGGGGTALAAIAALHEMGVKNLIVAGRQETSATNALSLAAILGVDARYCSMDRVSMIAGVVDLVISTVPAGAADHLAAELAAVPALFDAIYHPWPTPLAAAGSPDRVTVTGLDMLLHQAFAQVTLMTGHPAPKAPMREALRDAAGVELALPF